MYDIGYGLVFYQFESFMFCKYEFFDVFFMVYYLIIDVLSKLEQKVEYEYFLLLFSLMIYYDLRK